jgi:oligopeptidase B
MFVRSHTPPVAKQVPVTHTIHGVTRTDEYHWLREKDNPEVRSYLEDENSYADRMAAHLAEKRHHLYNELIGRIQQTDLSVPYRKGNFSYYMRTEEGKQYSIHCRKPIGSDVEEVVIDGNQMAEGHAFFSLGTVTISDCGRYLAYANTSCTSATYKQVRTSQALAKLAASFGQTTTTPSSSSPKMMRSVQTPSGRHP